MANSENPETTVVLMSSELLGTCITQPPPFPSIHLGNNNNDNNINDVCNNKQKIPPYAVLKGNAGTFRKFQLPHTFRS
jgi:hypothetical protein